MHNYSGSDRGGKAMNIIVAGVIGRYPYGGVAWCSMMYLIGLQRLGHNVWYLEDMGECNFDPFENTLSTDPRYALGFIHTCLGPYGLGDNWCYVNYLGTEYFGHTREQWRQVCADCDLFINLSGGCWTWRDEYEAIPHTAFIDSDPALLRTTETPPPKHWIASAGTRALISFAASLKSWAAVLFMIHAAALTHHAFELAIS